MASPLRKSRKSQRERELADATAKGCAQGLRDALFLLGLGVGLGLASAATVPPRRRAWGPLRAGTDPRMSGLHLHLAIICPCGQMAALILRSLPENEKREICDFWQAHERHGELTPCVTDIQPWEGA